MVQLEKVLDGTFRGDRNNPNLFSFQINTNPQNLDPNQFYFQTYQRAKIIPGEFYFQTRENS